jgi:hypothetical protein
MFRSVHLWFAGSARWNAGGDIAARCPYHWGSAKVRLSKNLPRYADSTQRAPALRSPARGFSVTSLVDD